MSEFRAIFDLGLLEFPDWSESEWFEKLATIPNTHYFDPDLNASNFPITTKGIQPGDKIQILVFEQVKNETTTSNEREEFLKYREAFSLGVCGLILAINQRLDRLPRDNSWYVSQDSEENLFIAFVGHKVPRFCVHSNDKIIVDLGYLNFHFDKRQKFIGFRRL